MYERDTPTGAPRHEDAERSAAPSFLRRQEPRSPLCHAERSAAESKHLSGERGRTRRASAFQYRGDVTVHTGDGSAVTGYLFNRDTRASEPFVQLFETRTGREVSLPYRSITGVLFTGRDAAAAADRRFEALQVRAGAERHGD